VKKKGVNIIIGGKKAKKERGKRPYHMSGKLTKQKKGNRTATGKEGDTETINKRRGVRGGKGRLVLRDGG